MANSVTKSDSSRKGSRSGATLVRSGTVGVAPSTRTARAMPQLATTASPATNRNAARHDARCEIQMPVGTPASAAIDIPPRMIASALPRRSAGTLPAAVAAASGV
jgi:hypothetical protein